MEKRYFHIHRRLQEVLGNSPLVAGIGNRLKGDDAAGPSVVDRLKAGRGRVIDCGVAPENYLEKIAAMAPDTVLYVDAVPFGGFAGEIRLFEQEDIGGGGISTHAPSLALAREYLAARVPAVRQFLLGIQPEHTGLEKPMSAAVSRAVKEAGDMIQEALTHA